MFGKRAAALTSAFLTLLFAIYYQLLLKDILKHAGYGRKAEALNNQRCLIIPELQACGKLVLHHPSGVVYLACSTPSSRMAWAPSFSRFNASERSWTDYVATYNPATSKITRLKLNGFPPSVRLALHGLDVVPSDTNPAELFVYLINHRPPSGDPEKLGADSVVEIFKTEIGGENLTYVTTVDDPSVLVSPNDLVGYGNGRSFHFTNNHRSKQGVMRSIDFYLRLPGKSVGYCHADHGCKFAASSLRGASGIAHERDDTYIVSNDAYGELFILEKQDDETFVLTDVLTTDRSMHNVFSDEDGALYIAASVAHWPRAVSMTDIISSPSSVLRLSRNTGSGQFYGEKFQIQRVFADDGKTASATTSAVWDSKRRTMYLSGLYSSHVAACKIESLS